MFVVTIDDAIAIHRAHQQGGEDAALAEVRRRWLGLADHVHRGILSKVLRLKVELPKPPVNERAPPSPGKAEDNDKAFQARERKRLRATKREMMRMGIQWWCNSFTRWAPIDRGPAIDETRQ